jgi:uncharacterized protein with FMN-binding domain
MAESSRRWITRRAAPVVAAGVGAVGLLGAFRSTPSGSSSVEASPPATAPVDSTVTTGGPSPTSTPPATAPPPAAGTFDGPVVTNRYGPVQVRITVQGGHITQAATLELPSDRARSARISAVAGPRLNQEALRAQSAHVDVVSGATYTSQSYVRSLQGALDRAGI